MVVLQFDRLAGTVFQCKLRRGLAFVWRLQDGAQISRCGDTRQREQQGQSPQQNCRGVHVLSSLLRSPPVTTSRSGSQLVQPPSTLVALVRLLSGPTQFAVGRSA